MPRRRRPFLRAAGANADADEADPNAPAEQPEGAGAQEAPPADQAPAAPSADESMEELTKLKGLLDAGVLTQDEFDAQKEKILQSM